MERYLLSSTTLITQKGSYGLVVKELEMSWDVWREFMRLKKITMSSDLFMRQWALGNEKSWSFFMGRSQLTKGKLSSELPSSKV
jgi:hypothetical protein